MVKTSIILGIALSFTLGVSAQSKVKKYQRKIAKQFNVSKDQVRIKVIYGHYVDKSWSQLDQEHSANVLITKAGYGNLVIGYQTYTTRKFLTAFVVGKKHCIGYPLVAKNETDYKCKKQK